MGTPQTSVYGHERCTLDDLMHAVIMEDARLDGAVLEIFKTSKGTKQVFT